MTNPARPTPAARSHFSDADLKATLEGRVRQLEGDREANLIQYEETVADPHVEDEVAEGFRKNIESLDARLVAVRKRLDAMSTKPA